MFSRLVQCAGAKRRRSFLVRREDVSDGRFGSLEKSVEVTYEAVEGMEGPEEEHPQALNRPDYRSAPVSLV